MTPSAVVVMGVAGAGKTALAAALAAAQGGRFLDADDLHSEAAVAQMRAGIPLTDADRAPWLDRVGARIGELADGGAPVFVACSALRRSARDRLRAGAGVPIVFVHASVDRQTLARRIRARAGHFMPVALLDSQLATLEPLGADERGVTVDAGAPEPETLRRVTAALAAPNSQGGGAGSLPQQEGVEGE